MPPLKTKQQRAKEQKASNARERQIAKQYLQSGPSIQNLYNAFTHWYNSVPFLGGQPETGNEYITGEPTILPGRIGKFNPKNINSLQQALDEVPDDIFKMATGVEKKFFQGRQHLDNMKKYFSQQWSRYIKQSTNTNITNSADVQRQKQKLNNYLNSNKYRQRFDNTTEYETAKTAQQAAINNTSAYEYQIPEQGHMGYYDGNVMVESGLKDEGWMYPRLKSGVIGHEFGHAASGVQEQNLSNAIKQHNRAIKPKLSSFGETNPKYYGSDDEIRTRFLNVAADANEMGIPLNDVFTTRPVDTNWYDVQNAYERSSAINYLNHFKQWVPPIIYGGMGYGLYNTYDR